MLKYVQTLGRFSKTAIEVMAWMNNYIPYFNLHLWLQFNAGYADLYL